MNPQAWLGFVLAAAAMGLVPGPGVMSIVGCALGSGWRAAFASVLGMATGNAIAMTLSLLGVGAVLAASALAFTVVKWAGAAYLVVLGIRALAGARRDGPEMAQAPALTPRAAYAANVAIGTFHPKTIVFFVAFVPQFIDPAGSYPVQAAILVATFCLVVGATDTLYALLASRAAGFLRGRTAGLWLRRTGGGVLIASGLVTAARN